MNWLAHLALADDHPLARLGQLAGDFVKGPLEDVGSALPAELVAGIRAHRRLDAFTDRHPRVRRSVARLAPELGRVAPIAVDVAYDHWLSLHWTRWHTPAREAFIARCYRELVEHADALPERLAHAAPRLAAEDWLSRYLTLDGVGEALTRIDGRIRFATALPRARHAIEACYAELEADFLAFYPDARAFVDSA